MKNKTVVALIVAAILIFTGGILFILGISYAGGSKDMVSHTEKTYVVDEPFENIRVDATVCDVTLKKTDGAFKAVCPEYKTLDYTVIVEDNTLCIRQVDLRRWYDFIGINLKYQEITLYLPEETYDALYIETDTGDITVPEDFSLNTATLVSDTGDIDFAAATDEQCICETDTGDIFIHGIAPTLLDVDSITGDISLESIRDGSEYHIDADTGNIMLKDVVCKTLTCRSSTGDVNLDGVLSENYLQIFTTTGDIEIETSDAGSINIETDTGRVSGSFLSSKCFLVYSNTGNISVPQTREGGECRIETDTGDIIFS